MPAETHRTVADSTSEAVVAELLAGLLGLETEIPADATLAEIGVDDLTLIDLVELLEHELGDRTVGLRFDDDDLGELETVQDLVDIVADAGAPSSRSI